jgi:hypothetical protein
MSNFVTPNMGLTVPNPGSEPGPAYATEISNDMVIIDGHNHANGQGEQVPTAGIDINADLTFNDLNAVGLRSTRFIEQSATLGGVGDLNCVYDINGDLWFNNGSGTPVQITSGSVVDVASSTTYSRLNVTNNYVILPISNYAFIGCDPTSNTIQITLPLNITISAGRLYIIKDITGKSQTNNIIVVPQGSDTLDVNFSSLLIDDNYWAVGFVADGISNWSLIKWNKYSYLSGEILNFNPGSTITGQPALGTSTTLNNNGLLNVNGLLAYEPRFVSSLLSPYTISASLPIAAPAFILVNTGAAVTINLPAASTVPGLLILIKDYIGSAATNNITVVPNGTDNIEGLNVNYIITTPWASLTLMSTGANWIMI